MKSSVSDTLSATKNPHLKSKSRNRNPVSNEATPSPKIQAVSLVPKAPKKPLKATNDHLDPKKHKYMRTGETTWVKWNGNWQLVWMDISLTYFVLGKK